MKLTKISPKIFAFALFGLSLAITVSLVYTLDKTSINKYFYYLLISSVLLIGINLLVAFIRVGDLNIPIQIKMKYFLGVHYNLPRDKYKEVVASLINDYGKHPDEKDSIRSFLFYSTIYFYAVILCCFLSIGFTVFLFAYHLPLLAGWLLPLVFVVIVIFLYGGYVMYSSTFSSSVFSNIRFTYKNIRNSNIPLEPIPVTESILEPKQNLITQQEFSDYSSLFSNEYMPYISLIDKMLVDLNYANNIEWYGSKYLARIFYDTMVNFGIMKKTTAENAARCFSTRFNGVLHGTFKGKEENVIETEKIKSEIVHVLRPFPDLPLFKNIEFQKNTK
ncbi:hypothetical protein OQX61_17865 [Pedobacter sp. PLR]|uniref:hypothetical protein n=1 Tax=Pedobacter sp. PLR TaxID=2994465 RepID=UPI002245723D|nr:hypothetical protein [Pedobacter sp. PLR]MCX2453148.1 hypothetical protein [Pedobacter sp. PLR]